MNSYATRVMSVPCWKGQTGYQPELMRRSGKGADCIEGSIWASKADAAAEAARMLEAAEDLFASHA